jgi:hypothetical protein
VRITTAGETYLAHPGGDLGHHGGVMDVRQGVSNTLIHSRPASPACG